MAELRAMITRVEERVRDVEARSELHSGNSCRRAVLWRKGSFGTQSGSGALLPRPMLPDARHGPLAYLAGVNAATISGLTVPIYMFINNQYTLLKIYTLFKFSCLYFWGI